MNVPFSSRCSSLTQQFPENSLELRLAQLEQEVQQLFDQAPFGCHSVAADGTYEYINSLELSWLGHERSELIAKRKPTDFLTPSSQNKYWQQISAEAHFSGAPIELELLNAEGAIRPISLRETRHLDSTNQPIAHKSLSFDSTHINQQRTQERMAAIVGGAQAGIFITDNRGYITQINQTYSQLTGYSAAAALGQSMQILCPGAENTALHEEILACLLMGKCWQGEIPSRRQCGTSFTLWLTITPIPEERGEILHFVGNFYDITESKNSQAEISRMANFDCLTQLPNRRLLIDRLTQALTAANRNGAIGAVLFIDLDNFKMINDTRGHGEGDLLLIETAQRLLRSVREGDSVARLGGDEFVVLLAAVDSCPQACAKKATKTAQNILKSLARAYKFNDYEFQCTASIGVTLFQAGDEQPDIFKQADLAMYQAKKAGRNTLRFFDPGMQTMLNARVALEQDLRRALGLNQLSLHFQAQVNQAGTIMGAEALLRWWDPVKGYRSPEEFIPLAEETGLILAIGTWVLERACAQLKCWETKAHTRELSLAVNVSARQFAQADFVPKLLKIIARSHINPAKLTLEITESMIFDIDDAIAKMIALRNVGVHFSMDDFGTGYSSLCHLTQLPLDQLKIDKSFVRNMLSQPLDEVIVRAIIGMAQNFGLEVIAEGVETLAQHTALNELGCFLYQGHLYTQDLNIADFEDHLLALSQADPTEKMQIQLEMNMDMETES